MAYDRYDSERRWRGDDDRDFRGSDRERGFRGDHERDRDRDDNRGFFDRMGDEFRSWFGDERDERDQRGDRSGRWERYDRDDNRPRSSFSREEYARSGSEHRNFARGPDDDRFDRSGREYRPMAGDYSRSGDPERESPWQRDDYRRTSFAGSTARSNHDDDHYHGWRRRQVDSLDRDYEDYRRERASKFEDDFGSWRERRQSKRELLRGIRENMDVIGSDNEHVGTVDRVAGDRLILTRSDPEAGGVHHSLSCSDIDRIEDNRVILDLSADKARNRWRDERRERALFEREDQGRSGPGILDRSFSGTYR
jgi:hypothetical protein